MTSHWGEWAALATALFWTATAMFFEVASRRVGSLAVNMIRMCLAIVFLTVFTWVFRGIPLPTDASSHAWIWLSVSGLVGFVFGDYFLFRAFALITSRISMLLMTLVPPITALIGWLLLGEVMTWLHLMGMFLTVAGIGLAIFNKPNQARKIKMNYPVKGILFAIGGALGQAVGLVLSKYGMGSYDAFAATQIRIIAGLVGFAAIILFLGKFYLIKKAFRDRKGIFSIAGGSFFGPFLGVSFSLLAVQHTATGIASTIMAMVPILIILPSWLFFKQRVTLMEVVGSFISVGGVTLFFI